MKNHITTYEQYCSVLGKNVIMEEIMYHDGKKQVRCLNTIVCDKDGGCRNRILREELKFAEREK
ncbi:MAG: hypothetical protein GX051_03565 [Clostridiales bacterium]|nr:hypothetical protein [Clostridiales bacterium]